MSNPIHHPRRAAVTALLVLAGLTLAAPAADAHPAPKPVISQVYGGGGNVGAPYQNDFIEVFNRLGAKGSLDGWSVQYAAATSGTWTVTPLSGAIQIGQYYLVAEASGGGAGVALPSADATGTINLNATAGKVALVSSFTPLTGACPSSPSIIDMVGYGTTANCFESSVAPTPSNTNSATRKGAGCTESDNNGSDFQSLGANPRNTSSASNLCAPVPSAPTVSATSPVSPANGTSPKVIGSADPGTTVEVFTDPACSGSATASGSAAAFASPGIAVSLAPNSTADFYALAYDASNTSACSATHVSYTEDSSPPAAPSLSSTNPASPANNTSPKVIGSAEVGSTVKLYTSSDCSGSPLATGSSSSLSSPGITISVPANSSTSLRATATDAAGNTSSCSPSPLGYTEDSTPPAQPALLSTDPASPANGTAPKVIGSAEPGSTVKLYAGASCAGGPIASGSAANLAAPGIAVAVSPNSSTGFTATATDAAGNASACSNPITYTEDSAPPAAPSLSSSDPASPANNTAPKLIGSAEPGAIVKIYAGSNCSGSVAAIGSSAEFASPGIAVSVAPNSSTEFHATATDAAGNTSACSDALTYTEDSSTPASPALSTTDPASPANNTSPKVIGSAEAATTVKLYMGSDCSGGVVASGSDADLAAPGIAVSVAPNSTSELHATATDAAGNTSACSDAEVTYTEDSSAPDSPSLTGTDPASPASNTAPKVIGSAESGATVRLYTDSGCSVGSVADGSAADLAASGITVSVAPNSTTSFYATATDAAGNTSGCSDSVSYTEDSSAPDSPILTATDPASPANNTAPKLKGSAEAGATVTIFTDSSCSSGALASGSEADLAGTGITVSVAPDSTTSFYATATDTAGNTSGCSASSVTYAEDSSAPEAPALTATDPASPANNTSPMVTGSAESGSTVRLYAGSDCSGSPLASGTSTELSSPGIAVSVAPNSSTDFYATATDTAGNTSICSTALSYTEDSSPPAEPSLDSTNPASPANGTALNVIGSAEVDATVRLYTDAACIEGPVGTGTGEELAAPGIAVTVAANSSTAFHATATDTAGNISACSTSTVGYTEDSTAPDPPSLSSTNPASPAHHGFPSVIGSAEASTWVNIYTASDCSGGWLANGSSEDLASFGIVVSVASDSTTDLYATATDAAGNTSACSARLSYTEDSTAPDTVIDSGPAGLISQRTAGFEFSSEPGAGFECSLDGSPFFACASAFERHGLGDGNHTFYVRAIDTAGNTDPSPATWSFSVDATAPEARIVYAPARRMVTKAKNVKVRFAFGATEGGVSFRCRLDGGAFTPCPMNQTYRVKPGSHRVQLIAIDAAGNEDPTPATARFLVKRIKRR